MPYSYKPFGIDIQTTPPPQQKIKLSTNVTVSDDFRREYDIWLAATFGYNDPILKENEAVYFKTRNMFIMSPLAFNKIFNEFGI